MNAQVTNQDEFSLEFDNFDSTKMDLDLAALQEVEYISKMASQLGQITSTQSSIKAPILQQVKSGASGGVSQDNIQLLQEENRRLKRTLLERFEQQ